MGKKGKEKQGEAGKGETGKRDHEWILNP